MSRTRAALAAITLSLAWSLASLALSGCLAGALLPEKEPPQPTAPSMPDAAADRSDEGAEAFARHYLAVGDYALRTGDVTALQVLAADSCRECSRIAFVIGASHQVGSVQGGERTVEQVRAMPTSEGADWSGRIAGHTEPSVLRGDNGEDQHYDGGPFAKQIDLTWTGDGWVVSNDQTIG